MSYFVIGVGGTGAKLVHSLVHLTAAGLLPEQGRPLLSTLVDSDQNNGNVTACTSAATRYARCKQLKFGSNTPLFANDVVITEEPWTPVADTSVDDLETIFDYTHMRRRRPAEADLMELLFSRDERVMSIQQGFRGRPAVGATVFGNAVNFEDSVWATLRDRVLGARAQQSVPLLLAGSIFGGSGASGVPTICRLLKKEFEQNLDNLRVGLILFLPYFTYDPVKGEKMQANPHEFAGAAVEALKYYHEADFLSICHAIYAVGERHAAKMPISSVGSKTQANPPHFLELIGGLGAIRHLAGTGNMNGNHEVLLASREKINTVTWTDLPTPEEQHNLLTNRLQQMILFAVSYHYIHYPKIESGDRHHPLLQHLGTDLDHGSAQDLDAVNKYVESFLSWLLQLSTPKPEGDQFLPGLVDVTVFGKAAEDGLGMRLKRRDVRIRGRESNGEFVEGDLRNLFRNLETKVQPNIRAVFRAAAEGVKDPDARGAGKLVRAIYDACKLA